MSSRRRGGIVGQDRVDGDASSEHLLDQRGEHSIVADRIVRSDDGQHLQRLDVDANYPKVIRLEAS